MYLTHKGTKLPVTEKNKLTIKDITEIVTARLNKIINIQHNI